MCRCVWINPASSEDWGSPVIQAQQMRYDCSSSLCNCQMQCIRDTHKFVQSPFFTVVSTRIHLCGSLLFLKTVPMISCLVCTKGQNVIFSYIYIYTHTHTHTYIYTGCPRRNMPDFGRVFLMLRYTDITQNTYVQSWTVTEIMAREVWNFDSCYTLIDYQIHIKTGRNMWFL